MPYHLTPEQEEKAKAYGLTLPLLQPTLLLSFGAATEKQLAFCSSSLLDTLASSHQTSTSQTLAELLLPPKKIPFLSKKPNPNLKQALLDLQPLLMKEIALLDALYEKNVVCLNELSFYILAATTCINQTSTYDSPSSPVALLQSRTLQLLQSREIALTSLEHSQSFRTQHQEMLLKIQEKLDLL